MSKNNYVLKFQTTYGRREDMAQKPISIDIDTTNDSKVYIDKNIADNKYE